MSLLAAYKRTVNVTALQTTLSRQIISVPDLVSESVVTSPQVIPQLPLLEE
jgi:hypothetical protein